MKNTDTPQNIEALREDMKVIGEYFREIAEQMFEHKISNYPIFIAHKETAVKLGKAIIDAQRTHTNWSYNASMLEEMVHKNIIEKNKIAQFKEVYQSSLEMACIFLATPEQMDFVFVPYEIEEEEKEEEEK